MPKGWIFRQVVLLAQQTSVFFFYHVFQELEGTCSIQVSIVENAHDK